MSCFPTSNDSFNSTELAIFQQAYDDACGKLDLDDVPVHARHRNDLAKAIMNAARLGERDPATLTALAIAFGMRNGHLPSIAKIKSDEPEPSRHARRPGARWQAAVRVPASVGAQQARSYRRP
jgi:hypothetical protein